MSLVYTVKSHIGFFRDENQDASLVLPEFKLFAVADGMGGHKYGKEAAHLTCFCIKNTVTKAKRTILTDKQYACNVLKDSLIEANRMILDNLSGVDSISGSTATAAIIGDNFVAIAHIGDSRLYHCSHNSMIQLTTDHNKAAELISKGLITKEEARHATTNQHLTRAIGVTDNVQIDTIAISWEAGNSIMLCSDGLYRVLDDEKIKSILLSNAKTYDKTVSLLSGTLKGGAPDNVTIILIEQNSKLSKTVIADNKDEEQTFTKFNTTDVENK